MSFYGCKIPQCLESLIKWMFGEGMHSSLGLEGLWLPLEKINLLGTGAAGLQGERRGWCQHEVMWLQDSLVRLIDLEPLPFLPGLPVSLPIIPTPLMARQEYGTWPSFTFIQ